MKYVQLPKEELALLEKEFIDFLVVNGISADVWQNIQSNSLDEAEQIIDQFSDVIWETTLRKIQFLEKKEKNGLYLFKCDAEEIHLLMVKPNRGIELDIYNLNTIDNSDFVVSKQTKKYSDVRELELFRMIQYGCKIANGSLYKSVASTHAI